MIPHESYWICVVDLDCKLALCSEILISDSCYLSATNPSRNALDWHCIPSNTSVFSIISQLIVLKLLYLRVIRLTSSKMYISLVEHEEQVQKIINRHLG